MHQQLLVKRHSTLCIGLMEQFEDCSYSVSILSVSAEAYLLTSGKKTIFLVSYFAIVSSSTLKNMSELT